MIIDVLAVLASVGVLVGLTAVLYAWFLLSLGHFYGVVARDVLVRWDAQLAELPESDRARLQADPPIHVLEALLDLPARRSRRMQLI
jgi:hypothetical protein